jgi:hypothetical protein
MVMKRGTAAISSVIIVLGLSSACLALTTNNSAATKGKSKGASAYPASGCFSRRPQYILIPARQVDGMTLFQTSSSSLGGFNSPTISANVVTGHEVLMTHLAQVSETLLRKQINLEGAIESSILKRRPSSMIEFIETVTTLRSKTQADKLRLLDNTPDAFVLSQENSYGAEILYQNVQSDLFSIPNSIFSMRTTIPNAPVLIDYTFEFGRTVANFQIYGGRQVSTNGTFKYINRAVSRLLSVCPEGELEDS